MAKKKTAKKTAKSKGKPFKKGKSGNPNGRPKGQRNWKTIQAEAIKSYAEENGKTPEEIEEIMMKAGIKYALNGDFRFYKEIMERTHGKVEDKQEVQHTGSLAELIVKKVESKQDE